MKSPKAYTWLRETIASKSRAYWIQAAALTCLGLLISSLGFGDNSNSHAPLVDARLWVYRALGDMSARVSSSGPVLVILIDDTDYYGPDLQGRMPIKRDYLGKLTSKLCEAGARVVALDFDFGSRTPDHSDDAYQPYADETQRLAEHIKQTPRGCHIVLPRTLDPVSGEPGVKWREHPTALDQYSSQFDSLHVSWGYLELPQDPRKIPLEIATAGNSAVFSFGQAVARAFDPHHHVDSNGRTFPFGSFLKPDRFDPAQSLSAQRVLELSQDALSELVGGQAVVLGTGWSSLGIRQGTRADLHPSPVGDIAGAYLHANYAAAILDNRLVRPMPEYLAKLIEVLISASLALFFVRTKGTLGRAIKAVLAVLFFYFLSYLAYQNLGWVIEVIIPGVLLLAHWLCHEQLEMMQDAGHWRKQESELAARASKTKGDKSHE